MLEVKEKTYLVLDYETRSKADLKKAGGFEYARHPSTEILCVAWKLAPYSKLKTAPVFSWSPILHADGCPRVLEKALMTPSIQIVAHNTFFEQVISSFVLVKYLPRLKSMGSFLSAEAMERWTCTAATARALSLPGKLSEACDALGLQTQKDKEGHRLMLKLSKPRRATQKDDSPWHEKREEIERVIEYCKTDVQAETELFLRIPPLSPKERRVWLTDQSVNAKGFKVDPFLIADSLALIDIETENLHLETQTITCGALSSTNQREKTLEFLRGRGLKLADLTRKTVEDALKKPELTDPIARRLLEIRQSISKTSTAKYEAFKLRSQTDGRCRDNLVYHAAHTGREGGAGINPQNFPRGSIKNTALSIEFTKRADLELIRLLYGNPMEVFSSNLRGVIVPSDDHKFFCGDWASIEVRVLFWMAHHEEGLKAFHEGKDLYVEMAAEIFNRSLTRENKTERELGKSAVLGCGFGMGHKKFLQTCHAKNQMIDQELAEKAVRAYRELHSPVVKFWGNLEAAAKRAVQDFKDGNRRKTGINRTVWWVEDSFLYCQLPSGRRMSYFKPELGWEMTPWGDKRSILYYYGQNPKTKKWSMVGTYGGKLVENVVQATARDIMVDAKLRLVEKGFGVVLSVHDEILSESQNGNLQEYKETMAQVPDWALGCPIVVECWEGSKYRK